MSPGSWPARLLLIAGVCAAGSVCAQDAPAQAPARYLLMGSVGTPLRLTQDDDYGQDLLAPFFGDALGGYVFASAPRRFRHGVGLGFSVNLGHDGGYAEPVYAGEQPGLMPAYLLYCELGPDVFGMGHLGVPIQLLQERDRAGRAKTGATAGVELAAALGYRLLAGLGLFAELFADAFAGSGASLHPMVGLELGVFLDYEGLP